MPRRLPWLHEPRDDAFLPTHPADLHAGVMHVSGHHGVRRLRRDVHHRRWTARPRLQRMLTL
jgi:hypothetical protein